MGGGRSPVTHTNIGVVARLANAKGDPLRWPIATGVAARLGT